MGIDERQAGVGGHPGQAGAEEFKCTLDQLLAGCLGVLLTSAYGRVGEVVGDDVLHQRVQALAAS